MKSKKTSKSGKTGKTGKTTKTTKTAKPGKPGKPGKSKKSSNKNNSIVKLTKMPENNYKSFFNNNQEITDFLKNLKLLLEKKDGLNSNTKKGVNCSIYLIKIKTSSNKFIHFIYDSHNHKYYSQTELKRDLPKLKDQIRWGYGSKKICKGITNKFVNKQYYKAELSILVYSKNDYSLCGVLLLNNLKQNALYLNLICSLQKVGGYLLGLTEKIAKYFNKTHIFLKSLEEPMPIYIHKGYEFIDGNDSLTISKEKTDFRSNPKGIIHKKSKYYYSEWGDLHVIKALMSNYFKKSNKNNNTDKKTHVLININGNADDGFGMYKKII